MTTTIVNDPIVLPSRALEDYYESVELPKNGFTIISGPQGSGKSYYVEHPVTLRRWANQGKIEHIKITNGDRRYNKKSLYELLNIPIENNKEKVFYIRSSNGNKTLLETQ